MPRPLVIVVVAFLLHLTLGDDFYEGDACQVAGSGVPGTCKTMTDCQTAIDNLPKGITPAHCGWKDGVEIVCCQNTPTPRSRVETERISVRKCKEYEEAAYDIKYISPLFRSRPIIKKTLKCFSSNVPLVVGGTMAKEKEFPHMALVGYQPDSREVSFKCGGSLISDQFILTAAHCILTQRSIGPPKLIRLGEYDRSTTTDDASVADIDVEQSYPHPSYSSTENYNDIALIKMIRAAQFNHYVRPACLADTYIPEKPKAIATGWGKIGYRSADSDVLMKVVLELYNDDECQQHYPLELRSSKLSRGIEARTQLCAGSRIERRDVCQGDSGGPLQVYHPHRTCIYSITGVTSFGKRCSVTRTNNTSGIYTRVYAYLDWIEDIVWPSEA